MPTSNAFDVSRRGMIAGGVATAATASVPAAADARPRPAPESAETRIPVTLKVNGKTSQTELDPRTTLLDALREHWKLTGTKKGCDHGQCGACTVIVEGRRINSCLTLAVMHDGEDVTTIEGLGKPGDLHPMQTAFVRHDGYQCGYCTPGQICSAVAVLEEIRQGIPSHATEDLSAATAFSMAEVKERMSGNICRCGAYANIFDAMAEVAGEAKERRA